ncbi:hypothetical protein VTK26DRAFT_3746 [Humicola hyalothermophila]
MADGPLASPDASSNNEEGAFEKLPLDGLPKLSGPSSNPTDDNPKTDDGPEPSTADAREPDDNDGEETWEARRRETPLDVTVTWHNFEHFKNRYSPTSGMAIIEVLRGHQHISQEVDREAFQRDRVRLKRGPGPTAPPVDVDDCWIQRIRIQSPQLICLLSRLTGHRDNWAIDRPRVFYQPFSMFYYYLPQMRKCLKILEDKWGSQQSLEATETAAEPGLRAESEVAETSKVNRKQRGISDAPDDSTGTDTTSSSSGNDSDDDLPDVTGPMEPEIAIAGYLVDSPVTLSHVRKYIEFVQEHIVPQWEHAAGTSKRKVRFNDLWMSFQPGELLYMPPATDSDENSGISKQHSSKKQMYQNAWRIFSIVLSPVRDGTPDDIDKVSKRCLDLHCYYLDYDGTSYVPVRHMFCIQDYEGERDITSFAVYPMRFVKDSKNILAQLASEGAWFRDAIQLRHLYYDGWTLPYGPTADNSKVSNKDEPSLPPAQIEHVDGDVIIDFVEGFKSEPSLGPGPSSWMQGLRDFNDSDWPSGDDDMPIKIWEMGANGLLRPVGEIQEKSQSGEWFCEKMRNDHLNSKPLLKAHEAGMIVTHVDDEDLVLLPRRVVAYTFRERKFVMLDIRCLKRLPTSQNAFKDLKIDEQHKRMVKSLVKSHLKKQAAQKLRPTVNLDQDLFRGKGSGLFILLHGVPGVGKTATAEAVAQASKKPLFSITCGDLGFSPKEVETALREIFRLAHHWDCVLLFDEADIFLSRRELGDLKRNALVSVFLRVLEYYSGILFLTTNRVGTLDEAFKSRIHVSLYYPPLSWDQTKAIFEVNIRKLKEIEEEHESVAADGESEGRARPRLYIDEGSILDYAAWHFDVHKKTPEQRWNGRQIRNAFQIAYSLAHFDMHKASLDEWDEDQNRDAQLQTSKAGGPGTSTRPTLDYRQFQMVADAIEKFEEYLYRATGSTDKDKAAAKHMRADDFDPYHWQRKHNYIEPSPPRAFHLPAYMPPERRTPQTRQRLEYQPRSRKGGGARDSQPVSRSAQQQQATPSQRRLLEVPSSNHATPARGGGGSSRTGSASSPRSKLGDKSATPSRRNDSGYSGWDASPRRSGGRPQDMLERRGRHDDDDDDDEYEEVEEDDGQALPLDEDAVDEEYGYEDEYEEGGRRYYRHRERGEMKGEGDEEEDEGEAEEERRYVDGRGGVRERRRYR